MLTDSQIKFLNRICPHRWTERDGIISVAGDVNMANMNLTEIPVQFGHVTGFFSCFLNKLTSLKGVPFSVGGSFNCQKNYLTSLEGGPKEVGTSYSCSENQLTSLIGAPEICNDDFFCHHNQLTTLEGCPRIIKGNLWCKNNQNLHILCGFYTVKGKLYYDNHNDLNKWIIMQTKQNIFVEYNDIAKWIENNNYFHILRKSPIQLRKYFSLCTLHTIDFNLDF